MSSTVSFALAFQSTMHSEMERDPSIFILGTDLFERGGHFAQLKGLGQVFGAERIRDTPISEAAMVAAGVGAAMNGMRPVVDLNFIDFALGAMDEIINQAAKMRYTLGIPVPLVIRGSSGAAGYAAQHANTLEGTFCQTPGLIVVAPATPADVSGLLRSALRAEDPVIFLMHKRLSGLKGDAPPANHFVPFGKARVVREGSDVTLVSYSYTVGTISEAANQLATEGLDAEVIDLRSLWPLDWNTVVNSVRKTGRLVVVSEAPPFGGVAAEVVTRVQSEAFYYLDAAIVRIASPHVTVPHSPPLMNEVIPSVEQVMAGARRVLAADQ